MVTDSYMHPAYVLLALIAVLLWWTLTGLAGK